MKKFRKEQIEKEIQRVLGMSFLEDIKLETLKTGFATVTYVKVSGDMSYVDVFVSILSKDAYDKKALFEELDGKSRMLRKVISDKVKLRHTPIVRIQLDTGIEEGVRLSEVIQNLK